MWLRGAKLIVLGLLGFCTSLGSAAWAQQVEKPPTANSPKIHYAVEDLILGDKVDPDSLTSRTYHCSPSEQFVGFTWCTNRASKGRAYTVYSILHSPDDKIVYANKTLERKEVTAVQRELIEAFAGVAIRVNDLNTRGLAGQPVNLSELSLAASTLTRLASRIGVRRVLPIKTVPPVHEYVAQLHCEAAE